MSNTRVVARRTFLGTAAVAVGAASGVGAFTIASRQEIEQAYARGMADGRQATLEQIKQIKGVPVHTAAQIAHTTQQATTYVALPVVQMLAQIAGDALSILISALDTAKNLLQFVPFAGDAADALGHIKALLTSWQANIDAISMLLDALTGSADVDGCWVFPEGLLALLVDV